jgi:RNA polymerase sigma-70 factor (ECF subfamily)
VPGSLCARLQKSSLDGERQNVRAWLYRVAATPRAINSRRRLLTWLPLFDEDPALLVDNPEASALELHAVEQALLKLDPDLRVPLVLYTCQELSTQEIADVLGISRDAVKQRLVRARTRFRELYKE